jgi:acetyl-CoA carboxylase carboxyltransferase component
VTRHHDELPHEQLVAAGLDAARPEAVERQHARGKLTARERIHRLVDEGSFSEIGALAAPETTPGRERLFADAVVTGIGEVDGRPVVVMSTDFTVAGGSNGLLGNEKQRRAWEIASTRGIPVVMLFDGGGHRIQEGLDARDFAGGFDIQEMQARLSGWVPMVAAVMGPGFGQPTLAASLCDYVVAVRGTATLGMAPPALVRAATGEAVDVDALNTPDAQASFGTIDLAVDTEDEALEALRDYLSLLPANSEADLPTDPPILPDPHAAGVIDELVPENLRQAYDMRQVIAGLVDEASEVELKAAFAPNLLTLIARVDGRQLGIIANQPMVAAGMLDAGAADKAAHLVSLCDAFAIPVLVLMDLPGLAVGAEAEKSGLARSSARLINELGAATVPTMTILARKGYGGGYVVMSGGRTFHPELVLAWPHAETAVMAVETAVELVHRKEIEGADDPVAHRKLLVERYRGQIDAVRGAEAFGFDAIVRPSETRALIARTLATAQRRKTMLAITPRHHPVSPL